MWPTFIGRSCPSPGMFTPHDYGGIHASIEAPTAGDAAMAIARHAMIAERTAQAVWAGPLASGHGTIRRGTELDQLAHLRVQGARLDNPLELAHRS